MKISPLVIHVRSGDHPVETSPLGLERVLVGADDDADIRLEDRRVSGRHCALRVTPEGIVLEDLVSKNGTWIGPVRVREVLLPMGTRATIGRSELWVESNGAPKVERLSGASHFGDVVGGSVVMRRLFELLRQAAPKEDLGILLLGETGTGKSALAKAVHGASGRRGPFVLVDCGAMHHQLIATELFGHLPGSFTGASGSRKGKLAEADGGTLFIDEIGDLPLDLQGSLLTAIAERKYCPLGSNTYYPFQAQIVAATHKNLRRMVREEKFRSDLYYRLAGLVVTVPPLRDRREDLPLIVESLLAKLSPPRASSVLAPWFFDLLRSYHFPGNVRELESFVRSYVNLPGLPLQLDLEEPPGSISGSTIFERELLAKRLTEAKRLVLDRFLRFYIAEVLKECEGDVRVAEERMGICDKQIYKHKRRLGLR